MLESLERVKVDRKRRRWRSSQVRISHSCADSTWVLDGYRSPRSLHLDHELLDQRLGSPLGILSSEVMVDPERSDELAGIVESPVRIIRAKRPTVPSLLVPILGPARTRTRTETPLVGVEHKRQRSVEVLVYRMINSFSEHHSRPLLLTIQHPHRLNGDSSLDSRRLARGPARVNDLQDHQEEAGCPPTSLSRVKRMSPLHLRRRNLHLKESVLRYPSLRPLSMMVIGPTLEHAGTVKRD